VDCYPEHLAPDFDEWGCVATPFDVWWARARNFFKNVPEEVAQYWIHEHWGHSPFNHLKSWEYSYERTAWPLDTLSSIRSRESGYNESNEACRLQGEFVLKNKSNKTAQFMLEHGHPPVALIVLDNRDGHLIDPNFDSIYPKEFLLIEGHTRFNISIALHFRKRLLSLPVWLMYRDPKYCPS
jgi:hypothetical protein